MSEEPQELDRLALAQPVAKHISGGLIVEQMAKLVLGERWEVVHLAEAHLHREA